MSVSGKGLQRSPKILSDPSQAPYDHNDSPMLPKLTRKFTPSFTTCLSIPVQGATPIVSEDKSSSTSTGSSTQSNHNQPNGSTTSQNNPHQSKRAPRKSKTDAIAAIRNGDRSSSDEEEGDDEFLETTGKSDHKKPIPVSPTLDMNSVKVTSPRVVDAPEPRPFGLTHCPIYYPTAEEFKDPTAYVRSISDEAKEYGICKIVPPEEWKMPFVTKTENFRFKTRLQRLNSIEASSRAKLNFLEQLYQYHRQQGNPRVAVPTINHKPLDLWLLRKEVQKLGGYHAVTKGRKWSDLGRILGYTSIPGLSAQIKNSYTRVILPYEDFCERSRNVPPPSSSSSPQKPAVSVKPESSASAKGPSAGGTSGDTSEPSSPLTTTSSPLSEVPEDRDIEMKDATENSSAANNAARLRRSTRMNSTDRATPTPKKMIPTLSLSSPVLPSPVFHDKKEQSPREYVCEICQKANHEKQMLLCDGCDCGYHMFCLDPPLEFIPKEEWYCYNCIAGTGVDFGFDEGEEHSLSSFQARDKEFRRMWFEKHPPETYPTKHEDPTVSNVGNVKVSEYDVEKEFWRLVQSPHETVEIEYGADVHSTTHGSAMPTMETHPLDPYSMDPWNLNNIPIFSDSLLRFIKSDISGMTVPWTYVGMTFSTFCWHNEDHYTYSINFMHWGETKTWYGIPGADAEKFEAAIKYEAPDLFEVQPDLLFQLVTLMNPKRVSDAGVRVYACNQRAGEFVITFPKAYHAGFNHGLNFNEAVNFALPDWLPQGRDCAVRYAEHRKMPVFSHDELLITITQQSQSIKTAIWLLGPLREMIERERKAREKARSLGFTEILREVDLPEDQYQCIICKVFCYLSQIICECSAPSKSVCIDHHHLLCESPGPKKLFLRKRFTDEELSDILAKVEERAEIPVAWNAKLNRLLQDSGKPALRSLRALLAEGERINHPLSEMPNLRKCIARANEWVENANVFLIRKHVSRKRVKRSRGRAPYSEPAETFERPERGLPDLYALLQAVESLGFDSTEISALQTLGQQAEDVKAKAIALLEKSKQASDRAAFVKECEMLVMAASSINVYMEELVEVDKVVMREQLMVELEEISGDAQLTPDDIRQMVARARACDLPPETIKVLLDKQMAGEEWEERAKHVLSMPLKSMEDLEAVGQVDPDSPVDPHLLDRIIILKDKAAEFEKQAKLWLAADLTSPKPTVQEVMKLASHSEKEFIITAIIDLKATADIALELETRCDQVLKLRYAEPGDTFRHIEKWTKYAEEHLRMFQLPNFDKLQAQSRRHNIWLTELPWYCQNHHTAHADTLLEDVFEATRIDDDVPPSDEYVTCICLKPVRPPPPGEVSDAVQCDHCMARFHGVCAANGGSCPFCDHQHWDGTIHKGRDWHFCLLPPLLVNAPEITKGYSEDWRNLEIIVHRMDRLSAVIGQFLSFASQPGNQRPEYIPQVRHYLRKLFKIQFAVSPVREVSFGMDLAGLHRILASQPSPPRTRKPRRPRFTFGLDMDNDWLDGTRCVCRGRVNGLRGYPTVKCEQCSRLYHSGCVFYASESPHDPMMFLCPLCCLRKNKTYRYSDVRVIPPNELNPPLAITIDTTAMLEKYSKEVIYRQLAVPFQKTLFVDLVKYVPGQPDTSPVTTPAGAGSLSNGSSTISVPSLQNGVHTQNGILNGRRHSPRPDSAHDGRNNNRTPNGAARTLNDDTLPSWSRWGTVTTPAIPVSLVSPGQSSSTPPPSHLPSRKRKFSDDILSGEEPVVKPGASSPSLGAKRRTVEEDSPHSSQAPNGLHSPVMIHNGVHSPSRSLNGSSSHHSPGSTHSHSNPTPTQTLSPSLRMIVSPSNHPMTLPRIEQPISPPRHRSTSILEVTSPRLPPPARP